MGFEEMIAEAKELLPPGTEVRIGLTLDYSMSLLSYYAPELKHPAAEAPTVWTIGSVSGDAPEKFVRDSLRRLVDRHNQEWDFIHSPEYAVALEKTKAAY